MNCDPIARWYRWLEYAGFGRSLERRRAEFLPRLVQARKVLLLGEGDGRFLAELLRGNRTAETDYVDGSAKMVALARKRAEAVDVPGVSAPGRARFHEADALPWLQDRLSGAYDAICTHFFLDCFTPEELTLLAAQIGRHAAPRSCWIVSEFRAPRGGPAAWVGRVIIGGLYGFFRVCTGLRVTRLPEHARAIEQAGYRRAKTVVAGHGMLVSELWERG